MTNEGIKAPEEFKKLFMNTIDAIPGRDLIQPNDPNLLKLIKFIENSPQELKKYVDPAIQESLIKSEFKRIISDNSLFTKISRNQ
jgi:hypothetical protein